MIHAFKNNSLITVDCAAAPCDIPEERTLDLNDNWMPPSPDFGYFDSQTTFDNTDSDIAETVRVTKILTTQ